MTSTLGGLIEEMSEYQLHYRILKLLVFTVCQLQCLPNGCEISVFWCSWYHVMHVSILRVSMRHTSFRFCLRQHKKIWNKIDSTSLCLCGFPFSIAFFRKGAGWLFGRWELVGSNTVNGPFWNIPGGLVSSYRLYKCIIAKWTFLLRRIFKTLTYLKLSRESKERGKHSRCIWF